MNNIIIQNSIIHSHHGSEIKFKLVQINSVTNVINPSHIPVCKQPILTNINQYQTLQGQLNKHIKWVVKGQYYFSTFSEAVASHVPCWLSEIQLSCVSWAPMSLGGLSELRLTIWTWPTLWPGKASNAQVGLGHSPHKPKQKASNK